MQSSHIEYVKLLGKSQLMLTVVNARPTPKKQTPEPWEQSEKVQCLYKCVVVFGGATEQERNGEQKSEIKVEQQADIVPLLLRSHVSTETPIAVSFWWQLNLNSNLR